MSDNERLYSCEYCEGAFTIDLMDAIPNGEPGKCVYCEDDEYYARARLYYLALQYGRAEREGTTS
ncbi:hypothetical protein LCGC14_2557980 [marine sediment metagenome]|uniref:Uncharacterized protein n=1 Tax=marine sediment metagenome TaxID=412755 RepID=A0A0F9AKX7_9ZZZZ